jgi:hypothetical protein
VGPIRTNKKPVNLVLLWNYCENVVSVALLYFYYLQDENIPTILSPYTYWPQNYVLNDMVTLKSMEFLCKHGRYS